MPSSLSPTLQLGDSLFWHRDLERIEWLRDAQDIALFTLCGERFEARGTNLSLLLADLTAGLSVTLKSTGAATGGPALLDLQVNSVRRAGGRTLPHAQLAPLLLNIPTRYVVLEIGKSTSLFGSDRLLCVSHDETCLWLGFTTASFCLTPATAFTPSELNAALKSVAQADWNVFTTALEQDLLAFGVKRRFWAERIKEYGPKEVFSHSSLRQHLLVLKEMAEKPPTRSLRTTIDFPLRVTPTCSAKTAARAARQNV